MMSSKMALGLCFLFVFSGTVNAAELVNWKDGKTKDQILKFLKDTTEKGNSRFVEPGDRIAVVDNDGTLWSERPIPVELAFSIEKIRKEAPKHPEWKNEQPFKAVLDHDHGYFEKLGEKERIDQVVKLVTVTHANIAVEKFEQEAKTWFKSAKDEKSKAFYQDRTYAPMLELLALLKAKGYKAYLVTGGDTDFVRAIARDVYGVPVEQVIGSQFQTQWISQNGKGTLVRGTNIIEPITNGPGKPVNIQRVIGKVPVIAIGNSDGDLPMLEYAASNPRASLEILIHHDDAQREVAYDEGAEKVLAEARERKWITVSMKNDFTQIFSDNTSRPLGGDIESN